MKLIAILLLLLTGVVNAAQNVVVVFDDSGSMDEMLGDRTKIEAAKAALITVSKSLKDDATIGIYCINHGWVLPVAPLNRGAMQNAVDQLSAGGGTPLGSAMKVGCDALLQLRGTKKYGSYRLLIITDGEAEDPDTVSKYGQDIMTRGIFVDVIGVKMAGDHQLATKVHMYRKADDPESLNKAITEGFAESTGQSSGENDYDLIATLPEGLVRGTITALADVSNKPVGDPPLQPLWLGDQFQTDSNGAFVLGVAKDFPAPSSETGISPWAIGLAVFFCLLIVLVLFLGWAKNNL